jgi:phosphopantothenoylcysteine decarboxylase/phosphopantothenate--cysteine ligase
MDEDMWHHPSTKRNLSTIESFGNKINRVNNGELASGLFGEGRMAEPEEIILYLKETFFRTNELSGKKVLVTAGPTYESIDPVRFIGNHSSGKMGFAISEEMYARGADVVLVTGPTHEMLSYKGIQRINVTNAREMYNECMQRFHTADIAVMSAAVADYTPTITAAEKIKKKEEEWSLTLTKTNDILYSLGKEKKANQYLAGFALETNNEKGNALTKLRSKNADCIILNSLRDAHAGFGYATNKITILDKSGEEYLFDLKSKADVAKDIVSFIASKIHE